MDITPEQLDEVCDKLVDIYGTEPAPKKLAYFGRRSSAWATWKLKGLEARKQWIEDNGRLPKYSEERALERQFEQ